LSTLKKEGYLTNDNDENGFPCLSVDFEDEKLVFLGGFLLLALHFYCFTIKLATACCLSKPLATSVSVTTSLSGRNRMISWAGRTPRLKVCDAIITSLVMS
jgi:hypothetical protein